MDLGFSGNAFGNLIVLLVIVSLIVIPLALFIAHKKGFDITRRCLQIKVLIIWVALFFYFPFWLSDLSVNEKIIGTIICSLIGIGNFYGIDRMQQILRNQLEEKKKIKSNKKNE